MNMLDFIMHYKNNCFWFFMPLIIFNIVVTKYLPAFYLKNIHHPIVMFETVVRIITILFSLIMMMNVNSNIGKLGFMIYIVGLLIYVCSYFIVIKIPASSFNNNLIVLLAPYWTSFLWLVGIGLLGNKLFINVPYHYVIYIAISFVFAVIHSVHGYLCYKN
jgi:hypothetical protein